MKRLLLPSLVIAVSGCGSTVDQPASGDAAKILSLIVRHQSSLPRDGLPTCLSSRTEGLALDGQRESLRSALKWPSANPQEAKHKEEAIRAFSNPWFSWRQPGAANAIGSGNSVSDHDGLQLSGAAAAIVNTPARPSSIARINWQSVPWRLQGWGWFGYCGARLSLTAPAFHGDLAFVEASYVCGGLCGYGSIYALRRKENEWTIVAEAMTWVS